MCQYALQTNVNKTLIWTLAQFLLVMRYKDNFKRLSFIDEIHMNLLIGRQEADDYICGCVVNSSLEWE